MQKESNVRVIFSLKALLRWVASRPPSNKVGFVPTMGGLHEGHMALLAQAHKDCHTVVCSIFVNPIQFQDPNDYTKYPRTLEADKKKATTAGVDLLFCPSAEEIYPTPPLIKIDFGSLTQVMEGQGRPGHFNGVAIVLSRLFHWIRPTRAYFGEKDWQQCLLAQQLVQDLGLGIQIVTVPTVREKNGLAISSRNARLTAPERNQAAVLYTALQEAEAALQQGQHPKKVQKAAIQALKLAKSLQLEYFEIVDSYTLKPAHNIYEHKYVSLCLAARVGSVRLIDNLRFAVQKTSSLNKI